MMALGYPSLSQNFTRESDSTCNNSKSSGKPKTNHQSEAVPVVQSNSLRYFQGIFITFYDFMMYTYFVSSVIFEYYVLNSM